MVERQPDTPHTCATCALWHTEDDKPCCAKHSTGKAKARPSAISHCPQWRAKADGAKDEAA